MKPSRSRSRSHSTEAAALALLTLPVLLAGGAAAQTLQNTGALSFGAFSAGIGGTVTVSPLGARSKTGAVVLATQGGTPMAAQFLITGTPGATYTITLPSDGTVLLSSGASTMALNGFTSTPSGANVPLGGGGTQTITVGATLTVSAYQAPGNYTGAFSVTVNYP